MTKINADDIARNNNSKILIPDYTLSSKYRFTWTILHHDEGPSQMNTSELER